MAITAIPIGRHVIARLAAGSAAIVARSAVACNALMIETGTDKGIRIVTNGAVLSGWNMGRRLACGRMPIVTRRAVANNTRMIIDRIGKAAWHVTGAAIGSRGDMIHVLSDSRHTIVAGSTVTDYPGMIEHRAGKTGCAMTNTAILADDDMRRRLRKGAQRSEVAIVARDTIPGDAGMRESRRIEGRCGVATVAILGRWHMY